MIVFKTIGKQNKKRQENEENDRFFKKNENINISNYNQHFIKHDEVNHSQFETILKN